MEYVEKHSNLINKKEAERHTVKEFKKLFPDYEIKNIKVGQENSDIVNDLFSIVITY